MAAAEDALRWVTLNEAADAAGVTISALTDWYRADEIAWRLERRAHGECRVVDLDGVLARARGGPPVQAVAPPPTDRPAREHADTVLVPLEAWQRALEQLGHLHEAGQQLAEARAAAAKHETTAEFLRERVRELKAELDGARAPRRRRRWLRRT